jgi:hypothetical protein
MSDSDGPPSDGPPPLVFSSSDDCAAAEKGPLTESSDEEEDEYDVYMHVVQQLSSRATGGSGWARSGNLQSSMHRGRLALGDGQRSTAKDEEAAKQEAQARHRREADERDRLRRQEENERKIAESARRAALADSYRELRSILQLLQTDVQEFFRSNPEPEQWASPDEALDSRELPIGTVVESHSLRTTDMNGLRGTVVGALEKGRIQLRFDNLGQGSKSLKPENLTIIPFQTIVREKFASKLQACAAEAKTLCDEACAVDDSAHVIAAQRTEAECLIEVAALTTSVAEASGQQACKITERLGKSRMQPSEHKKLAAKAHAAYAMSLLAVGKREEALQETARALNYSPNVVLDSELADFVANDRDQKAAQRTEEVKTNSQPQSRCCEWGCGKTYEANVTRREIHQHRVSCSRRHIQCENCKVNKIPFEELDKHRREQCSAALLSCESCQYEVSRGDLESGRHARNDCPKRDVQCEGGCMWNGPYDKFEEHSMKCPLAAVQCPSCLDEMQRWEMRNHMC